MCLELHLDLVHELGLDPYMSFDFKLWPTVTSNYHHDMNHFVGLNIYIQIDLDLDICLGLDLDHDLDLNLELDHGLEQVLD